MGRFLAVFGSILGDSGDDLGMIWACSGGFPGMFWLGKSDLYKFSKNRFCDDRWPVCSFLRRIRLSGSGPKINFTKNFGSGGDVVFRDSVMASETAWLSMASETACPKSLSQFLQPPP